MKKIECPVCGEEIVSKRKLHEGHCFPCTNCESILEVILTDPIELDVYYYEGEELVNGFNSPDHFANKDLFRCTRCKKMMYPNKKLWIGDRLKCFFCGTEHQVVSLDPFELDLPYDGFETDFMDEDFEGSSFDIYSEV